MNNENVKIDLASFSQGFLGGVFNGVGQGTGAVVGGVVYSTYGPHYLFLGMAAGLFPVFVVYVAQFVYHRKVDMSMPHDNK